MGLLDIFKASENKKLKEKITLLERQLSPEQQTIINLSEKIEELEVTIKNKDNQLNKVLEDLTRVEVAIKDKQKELIVLDDEILFQEFAIYKPIYDFANSDLYKEKLNQIRQQQKEMIKNKVACHYFDNWTVDGSKAKGRKMTNDNIKQILRSFNTECDNAIDKVKFSNVDNMRKRIIKSCESLNKLNQSTKVSISDEYLSLKLDELNLAYEYAVKKQDEKEEAKRIREEMREQAKLEKELVETRKNIDKEKKHYNNALDKILKQLENDETNHDLLIKKEEIESKLNEIESSLKDLDYREANKKAGYVYIISNIGSFGKDIYKIGMTRRLDPTERVTELSDASVPFNFDIHAMIFTEDAPKLEAALHNAFDAKKVNMVNKRREFFNVTLEEIEEVIKNNFDKTVEFNRIPEAEQFRESEQMRKNTFYENSMK
ncbi:DUF4041 domain-containing protein [Bacillus massiliigorillae]|uniref:DUF4041 domain-containing protein n=1 Tax=Bacillus massiliigorillae TaxID=1243664 RepID=UPI0003A24A91|nr:DUF4041 domain-containing protein [Bacillus massiliigorillae]